MECPPEKKFIVQELANVRQEEYLQKLLLQILEELLCASEEEYVAKCSLLKKELAKAQGQDIEGILLRVV